MTFWSVFAACVTVLVAILWYIENQLPLDHVYLTRMAEASEDNLVAFREKKQGCFIVGYTGEVGKVLLKQLLESNAFARVVLLGRREVKFDEDLYKDVEQHIVDFENLTESGGAIQDLQQGFCCLGTTRGKAGKEGFYKVDHDYVVNVAKLAKDSGVTHFHLVSSTGADHKSSMLFAKTKGEAEEDTKALDFEHLSIYRPGLLMCNREESRPAEAVIRFFMKPIAALFPTSGSIPTTTVATAMINHAVAPATNKVDSFDNKAIHTLAGEKKK